MTLDAEAPSDSSTSSRIDSGLSVRIARAHPILFGPAAGRTW